MKPASTNLVATRLANVAMSAKVPEAIIAAHQEESFMVHLRRQAVSVESEDEAEDPSPQRKFPENLGSSIEVPITSSFPQFSGQDLIIKMQTEDSSERDFMKYWATNKKPSTRERCRLPKDSFALLKQWDHIKKKNKERRCITVASYPRPVPW